MSHQVCEGGHEENANKIYKEGLRYMYIPVYNREIFAPFILHLTQIMIMK